MRPLDRFRLFRKSRLGAAEPAPQAAAEPMAEAEAPTRMRPMDAGEGSADAAAMAIRRQEDAVLAANAPFEAKAPNTMGFPEQDAIYGPNAPVGMAVAELKKLQEQQPPMEVDATMPANSTNYEQNDPERARQHQLNMILERVEEANKRAAYQAGEKKENAA